jgi:hypothetical protein
MGAVKMVVPVRLYPAAAGEAALRDTLTLCNQAAGLVSARAFGMRVTSKLSLQRLVYVTEPAGFLGVDLGIVNIATADDGRRHSGKYLNRQRHRARHLRARLQAKGTRSAKRLLKKRARTPPGCAHSAGTPVRRTGRIRPRSVARRAASLSTPT